MKICGYCGKECAAETGKHYQDLEKWTPEAIIRQFRKPMRYIHNRCMSLSDGEFLSKIKIVIEKA